MKAVLALAVSAVALLGCKSSAPYGAIAAALNTGAALGAAVGTRAEGGCYAVCTNGTWCNPRTGFCDRGPQCARGDTACEAAYTAPLGVERAGRAGEGQTPPVGLSPETGRALPPAGSPRQDGP